MPLINGLCSWRRHRHQPLRHALRGGGGLSLRHAASRHRLSSRYWRHLFPAAHARPDRALSCLDRTHHRARRGLSPSSRQPLHPGRAFRRDQGCARATTIRSTGCSTGLHSDPGEGELVPHTPLIDRVFSAPRSRRFSKGSMRSRATTKPSRTRPPPRSARNRRPRSKSPSANISAASRSTSPSALKLEFRLASHLIGSHDYREGIAARIAGKGRAPDWQPATLDKVDDEAIERLFTTPAEDELELQRAYAGPVMPAVNQPRSPKLNARISCNLKRLA